MILAAEGKWIFLFSLKHLKWLLLLWMGEQQATDRSFCSALLLSFFLSLHHNCSCALFFPSVPHPLLCLPFCFMFVFCFFCFCFFFEWDWDFGSKSNACLLLLPLLTWPLVSNPITFHLSDWQCGRLAEQSWRLSISNQVTAFSTSPRSYLS